jgi:hypothetical protein
MTSEESLVAPIDGVSSSVLDEFRAGFKAHAVMAMKRQEELNAASARLENASRLMEGIGQLKYRIDADLYWHMRAIYGPECWRDPDFTAALERDGVIVRVKGVSDKVMIQKRSGSAAANFSYKGKSAAVITEARKYEQLAAA